MNQVQAVYVQIFKRLDYSMKYHKADQTFKGAQKKLPDSQEPDENTHLVHYDHLQIHLGHST